MTHPVAAAILPLRDDAIARAETDAREYIARLIAKLEEAGWNLDTVAPRPKSSDNREVYVSAKRRRELFSSITTFVQDKPFRRVNDPEFRARSAEREAAFIAAAKEAAGLQYDAFVAKLVAKVGQCDAAAISGNHVWHHSILTVTKGDQVERWKTQQICNVSKLGLLFNQWPSRKVK